MLEGMKKTLLAGEALAAHRRVKISGSTVIYADAGDIGMGVSEYAIANAAHGAIRLDNAGGTVELTASAAITAGAYIYPAADGKVSMVPTGPRLGRAIVAASADLSVIECLIEKSHLEWAGMTFEALSDDKTLDAQDVGKVFYMTADAKTITLPSTAAGLGPITIMNGGADAAVAVNVSPAAADKIIGPDIAGTDDKDQINTKTTAIRGDLITITGDGALGWYIEAVEGIWAEEAA